MPEKQTLKAAQRDKRQGKAASTQAGEFIREEMHHIREGKHGARSTKQAIAIGLSKARRAGVRLPAPGPTQADDRVRQRAEHDLAAGQHGRTPSARRSRATSTALKREGKSAASKGALARQARSAAKKRGATARSAAARKAARTRTRQRS